MKLTDYDLEQRYNDMLDECYGVVSIGPYEYATSMVMREVDMIIYREGFNNWLDSELGETIFSNDDDEYFDNAAEARESDAS